MKYKLCACLKLTQYTFQIVYYFYVLYCNKSDRRKRYANGFYCNEIVLGLNEWKRKELCIDQTNGKNTFCWLCLAFLSAGIVFSFSFL